MSCSTEAPGDRRQMLPLRIEDNLRPPMLADRYSREVRDALSVALLLILASVLIPSWDMAKGNLLSMVAAHMPSSLLLAALGFLLALRCGALDLSVWAAAGLGGVVAAALILSGALFSLSSGEDPTRSVISLVAFGLGVIIWLLFVLRRRN